MLKKKWFWPAIGAVVVIIAAAAWYTSSSVQIDAAQAEKGDITIELEETGYTEAVSEYTLESPKTARVVAVYTRVGEKVNAEQDLILLDNLEADNLTVGIKSEITSIKAQIVSIQEQLEPVNTQIAASQSALTTEQNSSENLAMEVKQSQENYDRMSQLYQADAISKVEYETADYELKTAENLYHSSQENVIGLNMQLDSLNRQKSQIESDIGYMSEQLDTRQSDLSDLESELVVSSLNGGHILELPAKAGQVVAPGTPLVKIGGTGLLQIKADILSDDMSGVKEGQKVLITAPVLGEEVLSGEVRQIYPSAFEKTSALGVVQRRVSVIISLGQNTILKPGYEVTVSIETDQHQDILRLPRQSVRSKADGSYEVMLVDGGKIKICPVNVGLKNQDWIEITDGIKAGDQVVKDASQNLAAGSRVTIKTP